MSGISTTVTLTTATGELPVVVRELGLEDIRRHLLTGETQQRHLADLGEALEGLLFDDFALADLEVFTDVTVAALREHNTAPSEIARLHDEVRAMNRFFFLMLPKLKAAAERAEASALPISNARLRT